MSESQIVVYTIHHKYSKTFSLLNALPCVKIAQFEMFLYLLHLLHLFIYLKIRVYLKT